MSKTSTYAIYTQGMDRIAKVDGETIDIFLKNPNPVLLNQLTELRVMSRAWAEKHNSVEPKDIKGKARNLFPPPRHGHRPVCAQGMGA